MVFNAATLVCKSTSWGISRLGGDWLSYHTIAGMKDIPADDVDIAFFGPSTTPSGISTMTIFGEYGIRAQNLGSNSQGTFSSYLMMREFMRSHAAKVFLLDMRLLFQPSDVIDFRLVADGLPLSLNTISAVRNVDKTGGKDSKISYIVPLVKHHNAWKHLSKRGLQPFVQADIPNYYYGSLLAVNSMRPDLVQPSFRKSFQGWTDTGIQLRKPDAVRYEYLLKIGELCRENNIPLVLYITPAAGGGWTPEMHNTIQKAANEMDVPFIDFHMRNVFIDSGHDFMKDHTDPGHLNLFGAEKISRYIGRYLRDNFDLPDHRGDPKYAYMNDELIRYKREMFLANFKLESNMSRYLDLVGSAGITNYTVIFSVKSDGQAKIGNELSKKLRALGFASDAFFAEPGHSFIGIWQNGQMVHEARSKTNVVECRSVLPDGMKYYVKSAGLHSGNMSSIVVNGVQYSKNRRGFNVVVYDNATGRVVDSINWDTHVDAGFTFTR